MKKDGVLAASDKNKKYEKKNAELFWLSTNLIIARNQDREQGRFVNIVGRWWG